MGSMKHGLQIIDSDAHFTVDPITRNIANDESQKNTILQGDHNSERFTFKIPRYIDGHDMLTCDNVRVAYINAEVSGRDKKHGTGVYLVSDLAIDPSNDKYVTCSWLISRNATVYAGVLNFMLIFSCMDGELVKYRWKTNAHEGIFVAPSLDADLIFEIEYLDVIEQWKDAVKTEFSEYLEESAKQHYGEFKDILHEEMAAEFDAMQEELDAAFKTKSDSLDEQIDGFDEILRTEITGMDREIDTLKARMNTFASLPEGSTTGDAELADIRVGANGATYASAGEAVRGQLSTKVNQHEALRKITGKNLFDKRRVTLGAYLNGTESPIPNETSFYSDYIPVKENTSYAINNTEGGGRYICFYSANYGIIEGGFPIESLVGKNTFVTPENAHFLRISSYRSIIDGLQIEEGDVVTEYEKYYEYEPLHRLENHVADQSSKFLGRMPSKNLFNKDTITSGYYLMSGGELVKNDPSFCSDFMPVQGGETYTISNNSGGGRYICFYDDKDDPELVTGFPMVDIYNAGTSSFKVPEYARYMRISHFLNAVKELQIEKGTETTAYEPYYEYEPIYSLKKHMEDKIVHLESAVFNDTPACDKISGSISDNETLTLSDFPMRIKNGMALSFYGKFDAFTTMKIGKGYETYRGRWFELNETNLTLYGYEDSAYVISTVVHGLSVKNYIGVHISSDGERFKVDLNTISGSFSNTFDAAYDAVGAPFVMSTNAMTDCVFNAASGKLDKDVWLFGDSYFGMSNSRVIGQLRKLGYFENVMINGLAGIGSSGSYTELLKCLNFGMPKTVVWCVGMNDSAESYNSYNKLLIDVCEQNAIELVLAKIPTVPTRDKTSINETVVNSGLRYVDFYKAVGANDAGDWYEGYLDSDGVHPTELGAKALAMRMLIDVPEIMKY